MGTLTPPTWWTAGLSRMSPIVWTYAVGLSTAVVISWQYWKNRLSIPTYGGIMSFSRTLSARSLSNKAREECMRAYAEHPMMLIPRTDTWAVVVHSKYLDEFANAPDDVLSFLQAAAEVIQQRYTFGHEATSELYHVQVVRNQLTRNLSALFPDVFDEMKEAVTDYVGTSQEWKTVNVIYLMQRIISRVSNRIFVGLPLCRNQEWMNLMVSTAVDTLKVANFINRFPAILRPIVGWYMSIADKKTRAAMKIAGTSIEEKIAKPEELGEDDFLSWLISIVPEHERQPEKILSFILMTNFAAIHSSSITATNALYWLLARPQYFEPLLKEIMEVTARMGWTKDAIGAMPKLDSFMRESMRMNPFSTQVMSRKVLKPFTFSNGFHAPVGTILSTHLYATHHDASLYSNPDTFDGFRFLEPSAGEKATKEGTTGIQKAMYTTSRSYLPFGYGRHACPGRFFASMEIKLVLAYLIANYDMKWPDKVYDPAVPGYTEEGYRPPEMCYMHSLIPDARAEMLIRTRVSTRDL